MFAGIIERVCEVAAVRPAGDAVRLEVELGELLDGLELGASVAINGVCLTLAERRGSVGGFDVVPETWRVTSLSSLQVGDPVNVERSLCVGDRLDGHFVQGHVDGVGRVERIQRDKGEYKLWVSADAGLMRYIVRKGSIALDGTSLTVVDVVENRFSVVLIPTTLERTVLGRHRPGKAVNIETDILARVIISRLEALGEGYRAAATGGLTWQQLEEGGFLR
ncbi:MAG: riboflavin synthase [Planctomycetes bacterium]|nr:riboflavin synthase [Planctomycetota bacterium]